MNPRHRGLLRESSEALGVEPEELAVRVARKLGVDSRIIVRQRGGGLRMVAPGEKLKLKKDEFIINPPHRLVIGATEKAISSGGKIEQSDMDE